MDSVYSFLRHRGGGYGSTPSSDEEARSFTTVRPIDPPGEIETNTETDILNCSPSRGYRSLRNWCYAFHVFLVVLHVVLVGMLFTHPEHRFSVSINNTAATKALKVFLQAFYSVYTSILVFVTQCLAISAAMTKRQTLTAVNDICGAWSGIGAAINAVWQQRRFITAPVSIFLTLAYLAGITGLHVVSSSVIQFEAFNNTITSLAPSTLAWAPSTINLSTLDWEPISRLMLLSPLLSTAKGLHGNILYDVPVSGNSYTGASVNTASITAECGLLSNLSAPVWNSTVDQFSVDVSELGEGYLTTTYFPNTISFMDIDSVFKSNKSYIGYQLTTGVDLGNLSNKVLEIPVGGVETTNMAYYVACTLNADSAVYYLPMKNGKVTEDIPLTNGSQSLSWTIWSSGSVTDLTQAIVHALNGGGTPVCTANPACELCECTTAGDIYVGGLVGIPETSTVGSAPIIVTKEDMQNAVAQIAAAYIWLAGTSGASYGGFQQSEGERLITNLVYELRLNVNVIPVVIGLFISCLLLAVLAFILHDHQAMGSRALVTSSGMLELMWISVHSRFLQSFMETSGGSSLDQLRDRGMKIIAPLSSLEYEQVSNQEQPEDESNELQYKFHTSVYSKKGNFFIHCLCYAFHAILVAAHITLIVLSLYHPEHEVIIPADNLWITTSLSIFLQTFYTLYTAALVFLTQTLAISAVITCQYYLTALHDISQAWTGIGAALNGFWQQKKIMSSFWSILGISVYLTCVTALHITSATIMEFSAFNRTSIVSVQSVLSWPNSSSIYESSIWIHSYILPPSFLMDRIETIGLLNNTLYDVVNTTNSGFTTAIVNTTSLQSSCRLLSNLSISKNISSGLPFGFSVDGLGNGTLTWPDYPISENGIFPLIPVSGGCLLCSQYLYFLITADIDLDKSISDNNITLTINTTQAYVAACTLVPQLDHATFNIQNATLIVKPLQVALEPWKLWSPEIGESTNLSVIISSIYDNTASFCLQNGCSLMSMMSFSEQNISLHSLTASQLEQAIGISASTIIWMANQAAPSIEAEYEQSYGVSPVEEVQTEWRLNINRTPAIFACVVSFMLFILAICFTGLPSRIMQPRSSIDGMSVLEVLWVAAHSQSIHEHLEGVSDPSLNNLRETGMFYICLGSIQGIQVVSSETEELLE